MRLFTFHRHRREDPWADAPPWAIEMREMMGLLFLKLEIEDMATKENLDALAATVRKNTDATQSATLALNGYATSTAELTQALKDALANSSASDDQAVKDAVAAIDANNAALSAAVPAVASAVVANT